MLETVVRRSRMSTDAKPAWGMGWDRQEPAVGRRIYRWTKPGAKFHILWDGSGLWYATPYEESDEPRRGPQPTRDLFAGARAQAAPMSLRRISMDGVNQWLACQ